MYKSVLSKKNKDLEDYYVPSGFGLDLINRGFLDLSHTATIPIAATNRLFRYLINPNGYNNLRVSITNTVKNVTFSKPIVVYGVIGVPTVENYSINPIGSISSVATSSPSVRELTNLQRFSLILLDIPLENNYDNCFMTSLLYK